MSIRTFSAKWMTEEHEMVYDSALKMFQSWEDRDEGWREAGMITAMLGKRRRVGLFVCVNNNTTAVAVILVMKRPSFWRNRRRTRRVWRYGAFRYCGALYL